MPLGELFIRGVQVAPADEVFHVHRHIAAGQHGPTCLVKSADPDGFVCSQGLIVVAPASPDVADADPRSANRLTAG